MFSHDWEVVYYKTAALTVFFFLRFVFNLPPCRLQGYGQGKKHTFECQYPLLQAHLDR